MKILYVTTVSGMMDFFVNQINYLFSKNIQVNFACNSSQTKLNPRLMSLGCKHYELPCSRSINPVKIFKTISQIKKILNSEPYDIVHCHSPIAAFCTRIACRKYRKNGLRVIYTAHGFHFYRNSAKINWIIYFPAEKLCARWTDTLITINTEDYKLSERHLKAKEIKYVPGVGIDINRFNNISDSQKTIRSSLGIANDDFILLSIGELNSNKNQSLIIHAINQLNLKNVHYLLAGNGEKKEELISLAKNYGLENHVHVLGYRRDIVELLRESDVFIFPSLREGLSVSIMESMASGKPVICSDIRGNRDLIIDGKGGFLCQSNNLQEFMDAILKLYLDKDLRDSMGSYNKKRVQMFSEEVVFREIEKIYNT